MMNTKHELFTDRAAIIKLVEAGHRVTMDAIIWVHRLDCSCVEYTVVVDEYTDKLGKEKEFIYTDVGEAVDHYLTLVKEWLEK